MACHLLIDGLRSHFHYVVVLKINSCEEMRYLLVSRAGKDTLGSFTLHFDPPKQVYHNKSLDELDVQQCPISTYILLSFCYIT